METPELIDLFTRIKNDYNDWHSLWYQMADHKQTEYEKIKALSVFEFWTIYDLWIDRLERETANIKNKQRK